MDQENNIIIILTQEANSALLDIEKKYHLEESDEEWVKKIKEKRQVNINIVTNLIREFAKNNISEKNFTDSLQKDLSVDRETSEKIFKDVSENVAPFLKKITEEDIKKGNIQNESNNPMQSLPTNPDKIIKEENLQKNISGISPPIKVTKQNISRKRTTIAKEIKKPIEENTKRGDDTYRERID